MNFLKATTKARAWGVVLFLVLLHNNISFGKTPAKQFTLTPDIFETIFHTKPNIAPDGVIKMTWPRNEVPVTVDGVSYPPSAGLTSWAPFMETDASAAVAGDFIMTADEVQVVLKTLRKGGVNVVALHNHMNGEAPSFYFTHFWGRGEASALAKTEKEALTAQAKVSGKK